MAVEKKYVETPLMKQYYEIKAVHPDAILLFRVGDFYETFGDEPMTRDMLRWLYTALTRATEKLYLVNFDDSFFE